MRCRSTLLPLALLSACTSWKNEENVLITSEPPGAHIAIDGRDTGLSTPARVLIAGNFGADHEITLTKRGHRPAVRRVYQHTEGYTSKWIDGVYDTVMPPLPIYWTAGDLLVPFGVRGAIVPAELYVKLYRTDEPLLGFELLAERNAKRGAVDSGK